MGNILEIKNLTKKYKNFTLDNVSFNIEKGYIMGFIGQNGAGKTTVIKAIMNLVKKTSGEIKVFGKDNIEFEKEIKEKIAFVYDEPFCYEHMTLETNAKSLSKLYSNWDNDLFNSYLKKFRLNKDEKVNQLSKGMKMKFSIALALSHNAEFIIMDEPTSGLDPVVRSEILDIFYDIIQDGNVSILISTHITTDLEKIADYITYIKNGKIVFSESKEEVLEKYKIVKGDKNLITKENEKYLKGIVNNAFGFEGLTSDASKAKDIFGKDVILENASLEDIMVYISK